MRIYPNCKPQHANPKRRIACQETWGGINEESTITPGVGKHPSLQFSTRCVHKISTALLPVPASLLLALLFPFLLIG
ncbi:hypothetical protein M011DRAFT_352060 [Sporormia fimetaria CBS 119925]|uniref:Uncharacterized protein n=1 Tax=Sporormia fimetaria CBS 119925 TaxID=1340428 RepID=A0A6A6VD86_9PLEO|nr:hypothetical protein M011DRAFT_352060 [Sporormia fimetaria CBS 119925]